MRRLAKSAVAFLGLFIVLYFVDASGEETVIDGQAGEQSSGGMWAFRRDGADFHSSASTVVQTELGKITAEGSHSGAVKVRVTLGRFSGHPYNPVVITRAEQIAANRDSFNNARSGVDPSLYTMPPQCDAKHPCPAHHACQADVSRCCGAAKAPCESDSDCCHNFDCNPISKACARR